MLCLCNFKAYYSVTIDGKLIHNVLQQNLQTFDEVKVFAGDNFYPASDASYRNLFWENLPVPNIMFHQYTPTIVSLEHRITINIMNIIIFLIEQ